MKIVSMKRDQVEKDASEDACSPCHGEQPDYPWGLRLNLGDEEVEALGLKTLPSAGALLQLAGIGKVMGVREEEVEGKTKRTLEIQITDLGLQVGDGRSTADRLYGPKGGA